MNQEPHKTRLWNGAGYKGGAGERQAGVPARSRKLVGSQPAPFGGDAVGGLVSTGPIRRSFQSVFRDRPPAARGRKGAYWQTSGLKKQAGSAAINHIGAPAWTVFEGETSHRPARLEARPVRSPLPARPAARPLLSCTAGGGGRRFRPRRGEGRPCRRPSRRPFPAGAEPFRKARIPVVILSRAPLMAGLGGYGRTTQIPIASVEANVFELLERPFGRPVFAPRVARASGTRRCL